MGIMKKLGKSGMFGLAGLAASNPDITNKIARNGGLGIMGMLAAKKKKAGETGRGAPADRGAPMMSGDVDAMMGRSAQRDMSGMKKGGKISAAQAVHKHERAKHKGQPLTKMAKGGSASKRGDGCATQGKTRGKFV
jgi:hypothetical protein